jgi:hypothetical protein
MTSVLVTSFSLKNCFTIPCTHNPSNQVSPCTSASAAQQQQLLNLPSALPVTS